VTTPDDDLAMIPGFSPRPSRRPDLPGPDLDQTPSTETTLGSPEPTTMAPPVRGLFGTLRKPRPDRAATPTPSLDSIGDAPKITRKETVRLVSGILVILVGAAAMAIAYADKSGQRTLRRPTDDETGNIAAPVASFLVRHLDPSLLNPDLADLLLAGSATVDYLSAGPLIVGVPVDPGLPADVQAPFVPDAAEQDRPIGHPYDF